MTRRLLGPVGGPVVFVLVAGLVVAGLGWVTVAALEVETAQRTAAAQADWEKDVRAALWRLDGRMLPALGVEDSRPFHHYASYAPADPAAAQPTAPQALARQRTGIQKNPTTPRPPPIACAQNSISPRAGAGRHSGIPEG